MYFLCPLISFHGHVDSNFALNIHINCTLTERSPPFLFKPMYDKLYFISYHTFYQVQERHTLTKNKLNYNNEPNEI